MIEQQRSIQLLTAKDLQRIFGLGKNQAYELMKSEAFPSVQINSRWYIERGQLEKWLATYAGKRFVF